MHRTEGYVIAIPDRVSGRKGATYFCDDATVCDRILEGVRSECAELKAVPAVLYCDNGVVARNGGVSYNGASKTEPHCEVSGPALSPVASAVSPDAPGLNVRFERITADRRETRRSPERMAVGDIVLRKQASKGSFYSLRSRIRKCMRERGMEFSIGWDGQDLLVRRDR